ncbi:hypothetical protein NS274_01215 [Pseudomonas oryzihabitans]|nr:hypothetical protein BJP27_19745 [Pseudomonas psychrotolerans]KTS79588.1 hypothetical protein NS274_01215 [Pseudomonas psychrotolerans]KTT11985.1 hypothetical protein NS2R_11710 [Pseudomonas psychrotolerans]KTT52132.1 hypothetical protein SB11R_02830 [Pseudomonas psychrotolerans]KTT64048.1 hypothetical protein NS383_17445 [Pseudomonas psychrotolerans]
MTSAKPPAHVLQDLEAIRQVLDKSRNAVQPSSADGIPILSDVIAPSAERLKAIPPLLDQIVPDAIEDVIPQEPRDDLARVRLRQEAPAILQELLDEELPRLEAELQRRLQQRLDELLQRP